MLIGTVFGVFITPVLFVIFQGIQESLRKNRGHGEDDDEEDDNDPCSDDDIHCDCNTIAMNRNMKYSNLFSL